MKDENKIWLLAMLLIGAVITGFFAARAIQNHRASDQEKEILIETQRRIIERGEIYTDSIRQENKDLEDQLRWYRHRWEQELSK